MKVILPMTIRPAVAFDLPYEKCTFFFQHPHYQKEKAAGLNVLTIHLFMVKSLHYSDHRINAKTLWSSTCEWRSELHGKSWSVICVSIILRSTGQIKEIKGKKKRPFRQAEWLELILEAWSEDEVRMYTWILIVTKWFISCGPKLTI